MQAFISYNKQDQQAAQEIALYLTADGVGVWYDEWEVSAGDSIVGDVEAGLQNCTHFVILWSTNAAKSGWVKKELASVLTKAIASGKPTIIPVLLDGTELPVLISDIKNVRYGNGSEEDRRTIVSAVTGTEPSGNLIRAVVKKYHELILDPDAEGPFPYKACPKCGGDDFAFAGSYSMETDDNYYSIKCRDCGWEEWSQ
jgi:hypothetical protein